MQNESEVVDARPDMELLSGLDGLITHISAMGEKFDRVSSSFAPKLGVAEDRGLWLEMLPSGAILGKIAW